MFYIGNFADMDVDESDWDSDNQKLVIGEHDNLSLVDIDEHDVDDDGVIYDNEGKSSDYLSYDVGNGPVSSALDSSSLYEADILLGDGSVLSVQVLVLQSEDGDVFVSEYPGGSLDGLNVQSITLTDLVNSNAAGINAGNSDVEGASVVCFCMGTRITTPTGPVPVEMLKPGDMVSTLDHGPQPVVWQDRTTLIRPGSNAPILFAKGSLGDGSPSDVLRLSPQHRVFMRSRIAKRMYGTSEILLAARYFEALDSVARALPFMPVTYHHFACRSHEIIFANGAQVETFLPGPTGLKSLSHMARAALPKGLMSMQPARKIVRGQKARNLIRRHAQNPNRRLAELGA